MRACRLVQGKDKFLLYIIMKLFYAKRFIILIVAAVFLSGCATKAPRFTLKLSLHNDVRQLGGSEYVPLGKLCSAYDLSCDWDDIARTATIKKGQNVIIVRSGGRLILVNGSKKKLDRAVVMDGGTVYVPLSFIRDNLTEIIGTESAEYRPVTETSKKYTIKTVVLDPGHGDSDPGAIGGRTRVKEKDMTLALARKLKDALEAGGIRVVMTRNSDVFIPLGKRARIANNSGADLFVSVHFNASRSRSLRGFECYFLSTATDDNARALEAAENASVKLGEGAEAERSRRLDRTLWDMTLTENRRESSLLAGYVCDSVRDNIDIGNRGIRTARFYVLKYTRLPSILVESGYISNRYDEAKLRDPAFLDGLARAIAQGILKYRNEYERTEAFTR